LPKSVSLKMKKSVKVVSLKSSIPVDLNSLNMFSKLFAARRKMLYHQTIQISVNSFQLMGL